MLDEGTFQLLLIVSGHISYKMIAEQMMVMLEGMFMQPVGYVPLHSSM